PIAVGRGIRQPPGATERDPVLMPVQLPDDFVIATGRVEEGHVGPESARRTAAMHGVEVPVDSRLANAEGQAPVAEQVVLAGDDAVPARRRIVRTAGELADNAPTDLA